MYKGLQRFVSPFKVNMNLTLVAVAAGVLLLGKIVFRKALAMGYNIKIANAKGAFA